MSVLVIQIPPRARLLARAAPEPAARPPDAYDHVLSADHSSVASSGRCAAAQLPKAGSVIAVLADADVSWHRVTLPKAPAARLRAALAGVLEEALLDDDDTLHFAVAPQAVPGQPTWIAVVNKPWLAATLATLEGAGLVIDRVVPANPPGDEPRGHFHAEPGSDDVTLLSLAQPDGAACLRIGGSLARALLPADPGSVRWTATPAAAAAAERWLGMPVTVLGEGERALRATASAWNLRQFDLAPRNRGTLALRDAWRRFLSPDWRPVRIGLAALAAVQVLGLNAWAWHQQRALDDKRAAMAALLRSTHPGVRAVIDPPAQMQRQTEVLRAAAGRPGDGDLEVLLAAAAAAWPDGQGPVQTLRFETGRLTLAAPGWGEPQIAQFRDRLRPAGFAVELAEGRITLSRSAPGAT